VTSDDHFLRRVAAMTFVGDIPIEKPEDDALERADLARTFADRILDFDVSQGFDVGIGLTALTRRLLRRSSTRHDCIAA
jgi:hypothetical protein